MQTESAPILLVIDHFGSGGAQRQIVAIANGLVALGYNVHIFIYYPEYDHHKKFVDERVTIHEIKKSDQFGLNIIFRLVKLYRLYQYKSILVFLNTPAVYVELASLLSLRKKRVVYSERSSFALESKGFVGLLKRNLHKICDHITSNSMLQTQVLANYYGKGNVSYIPNIMPKNLFETPINGAKYKNKKFVIISHTAPFKNYRYVANALIEYEKIYSSKPPVIHWYGGIFESDEMDSVFQLLKDNNLHDNLVFHGIIDNVGSVLQSSYFLIHPSKYESSANSVSEALTTGTPTILGNISDHPEIVAMSNAGWTVNLDEPRELATKLNYCISLSSESYFSLCDNARQFSNKYYKPEAIIAKYRELLS